MKRKPITEAAGIEESKAQVVTGEQVRSYWRGMLCSEYPAAEDAEGGAEKAESMIKAAAAIMRRGFELIGQGTGVFLFLFNGMKEDRPTDAEIDAAILARQETPPDTKAEERTTKAYTELLQLLFTEAALLPFMRAELRSLADDPAARAVNMLDYLFTGEALECNFVQLLKRARAKQGAPLPGEEIHEYTVKRIDAFNYPLDKVNSKAWNWLTDPADIDGQMRFDFEFATGGKRSENALVFYSVDFSELEKSAEYSRQLTPFDKRCYIAAGALFNAGYDVFSLGQLYNAMGFTSKPNSKTLERINESVRKMMRTNIVINNMAEVEAFKQDKSKYLVKYEGHLLPAERIEQRAKANGKLIESAIHLYHEPRLITLARKKGQITTINVKLLESPINKTEENIAIEDYLIERISHIKGDKKPGRILYATICEQCKITAKKQRQRLPAKVSCILEHQKKSGWITAFEEQKDGVTITP